MAAIQQVLMAYKAAPTGPTDPMWSSVKSLLSFDGNFTDKAGGAWARTGSPVTTTSGPRFGAGCVDFTGTKYIGRSIAGANTGDFTVEMQLLRSAAADASFLNLTGSLFYLDGNGDIQVAFGAFGGGLNFGGAIPVGAYRHIAIVRSGAVVLVFVDGMKVGETTIGGYSFGTIEVRYGYAGLIDTGVKMDEARITFAARYTANFTPPAAPFPNS